MISKETFITIINNIKEQEDVDNAFGESLETVCDSYCMYGLKNKKYESLMLLLKEIFNDKGEWISWWLYEDVKKVVTLNNNLKGRITLKTPAQLYDFLIENQKENNPT